METKSPKDQKNESSAEQKSTKQIFEFAAPSKSCNDPSCPYHGKLVVRGRRLQGMVTSAKMHRTVIVEWERKKLVPKYQRYERRRSKVKAHNPDCINAQEGDKVIIMETRPVSKTKNFVVMTKNERN